MSYQTVLEGLHAVYSRVNGLQVVLDYEPTAIHETPLLYSLLDGFDRSTDGTMTQITYRIRSRLILRWQHNERAEEEITFYVNEIPAALDADPQLGRFLPDGVAQITSGDAGWYNVGGTEYRVLDFTVEVIENTPYQGGE